MTSFLFASWVAGETKRDDLELGDKASGLLTVPDAWVPPFLVVTRSFVALWRRSRSTAHALNLVGADAGYLESMLHWPADSIWERRLLVRSSAVGEGLAARGTYHSYIVECDFMRVCTAVDQVIALGGDAGMPAIVQVAVQPGELGHMSNERRVSSRRVRWLVESAAASEFRQETIEAAKQVDITSRLAARDRAQLLDALRNIAGFLTRQRTRPAHVEWIWDGRRAWILQVDDVADSPQPTVANSYVHQRPHRRRSARAAVATLEHFSDVANPPWRKLQRPLEFRRIGLPTADVYVLSGRDWHQAATHGIESRFLADLERLCIDPVVVRCDIASPDINKEVLLPTSSPSTKPNELLAFMRKVAADFAGQGVLPEDWAFLLAALVPARASAMVYAEPGTAQTQVDAAWGFPDGLMYYPHDTYHFRTDSGLLERQIGYKSTCLLYQDGCWKPVDVGPPDDWAPTLSPAEISHVSRWAIRLADHVGKPIQLMVLARISGQRGAKGCLPWHYTTLSMPGAHARLDVAPLSRDSALIRTIEDLDKLRVVDGVRGLLLRPAQALLRDHVFLEKVGATAVSNGLTVYFEGSLLGHAYYLLAKSGARVVPIAQAPHRPRVVAHEKLVRDEIPALIRRAGGLVRVSAVSAEEAKVLLAHKVLEEAFEVWTARGGDVATELADLFEAGEALASQYGLGRMKIEEIRDAKRRERGAFEKLILLEETGERSIAAREGGRLPLLLDDEVLPMPQSARRQTMLTPETPRGDDELRFRIRLLPPARARSAAIYIEGMGVSIEYGGRDATVAIASHTPVPPGQMKLFDDTEA